MSAYLPDLLLAWSILAVAVASPGPSVALILGVATRRGRAPAVLTAGGVALGSFTLGTITILGVTAILAQVAEVMTFIRWFGVAYLLWLAFKALRTAAEPATLKVADLPSRSTLRTMLAGYLLHMTNPKAILFWIAIAAVANLGALPWAGIALFMAVAVSISFLGHAAYAVVLSSAPIRALYLRGKRWIETGLGGFFIFASYKLATAKV